MGTIEITFTTMTRRVVSEIDSDLLAWPYLGSGVLVRVPVVAALFLPYSESICVPDNGVQVRLMLSSGIPR
jgi:hypothetical protein